MKMRLNQTVVMHETLHVRRIFIVKINNVFLALMFAARKQPFQISLLRLKNEFENKYPNLCW